MKTLKISLLFVLFLTISSCNVNNPADDEFYSPFSLAVGNKYIYENSFYNLDTPYFTRTFRSKQIVSDKFIDGEQYFVFDDGLILRGEQNTIYQLMNGNEIVYFSFDVNVGDIVIFDGYPYLVKKIETREVFDERTIVYTIVNANFRPDSIVQYSFSRKFGILSYHHTYLNYAENLSMIGAVIKGTKYGQHSY